MGDLKVPVGAGAWHLCLDMQRLFSADGPWPTPWMERVLPTVIRVAAHAPARTVFTRFIPPRDADAMPGMWRAYYRKWAQVTRQHLDDRLLALMPALQQFVPPGAVFDKMVYSAFVDGRLAAWLAERRAETLIIIGAETDVCVLSSVLSAVDHGYRVVLVRDALCSSSDRAHDALLDLYRQRFDVQIELAEAAEVIESWRP